jgi:hypothetical protein
MYDNISEFIQNYEQSKLLKKKKTKKSLELLIDEDELPVETIIAEVNANVE